jgi:CHASE2 domain-containing sensor protein
MLHARRPPNRRRIRWWLHFAVVLSVIGIRRFARTAATRRRPIFLVSGALLLVIGMLLGSSVAFVIGMLVIGSAAPDVGSQSHTAAMVRTWMWLHRDRTDHP